jgi:hypothetical protein
VWRRLGQPFTQKAKSNQEDWVVALVLLSCPPAGMDSEPRRTLYGPNVVTPSYFARKEPWVYEARASGFGEEARSFPTLVDLVLHHSGTTKLAEDTICVVKDCTS